MGEEEQAIIRNTIVPSPGQQNKIALTNLTVALALRRVTRIEDPTAGSKIDNSIWWQVIRVTSCRGGRESLLRDGTDERTAGLTLKSGIEIVCVDLKF